MRLPFASLMMLRELIKKYNFLYTYEVDEEGKVEVNCASLCLQQNEMSVSDVSKN